MTTKKRMFAWNEIYHVYNRWALKHKIFYKAEDYHHFINSLIRYKELFPVKILAFSVMPNHFHLLLKETEHDPAGLLDPRGLIPTFMHRVSTAYAKYFQSQYRDIHSWVVFQWRFKSKHVKDDSYFITVLNYIHKQATHHKLTKNDHEWAYSSLNTYLNIKHNSKIIDFNDDLINLEEYPYMFKDYKLNINEEFDD